MHLKSLHLENYRKYKDQYIEFPTGIIGIVGRNGAGKSSLIEAIGWCLYGIHAARTNADQIRTTGAVGSNCRVTLEFILDSDAVKVVRELRGDNSSGHASAFLNGSEDAQVRGTREVTNYIAERTGMDQVAFFISVFARQKELDSLSGYQPEQRKKTMMRLLRINRIDDAVESIRADNRESARIISTLEENLKDMDALEEKHGRTLKEKRRMDTQIRTYGKKIVKMTAAEGEAKKDFMKHKKKYEEHNAIDKQRIQNVAQAKSKAAESKRIEREVKSARVSKRRLEQMAPRLEEYESVERQKTDLDNASGRFGEMKALKRQHVQIKSKISKTARSIRANEKAIARLNGLDSKLQRYETKLSRIQATVDGLASSASETGARIKASKKEKQEYAVKLAKIKELGEDGTCPTCDRPLQDHFPRVSRQYEDKISGLGSSIHADLADKKRFESRLRAAKDQEERVDRQIDDVKGLMHERKSLQKALKKDKEEHADLIKDESSMSKKIDSFSGLGYDRTLHRSVILKHKRLLRVKEDSIKLSAESERMPDLMRQRTKCLKKITELQGKTNAEEERLREVGYNKVEYQRSEKKLAHATAKLTRAREERIKLEGDAKNAKLRLEQITNDMREEEEKHAKLGKEREKVESRSKLEQVMGSFRLDLISRIRPMLSQRASEMITKITQGRYSSIELDDEYNMQIEDEGTSFATGRFSGGEVDVASLCLRVAISQELAERTGGTQANFIALDEIFGSQDEERKRNILSTLQALSDQFSQILVITHIEDVREALPYALVVKEDSKNMSNIQVEGSPPSLAS